MEELNDCSGFIGSLNTLCGKIPEAEHEIYKSIGEERNKKWNQSKINALFQSLGICILNPKFTGAIGYYLQAWVLEILGWSSAIVGEFGTQDFNLEAHRAMCVCLSKLLNEDIIKFAQLYFQETPAPFYFNTELETPSLKKLKMDYEIPKVDEAEIIEATYTLLKGIGPEAAKKWDISNLLAYLEHKNETVRWFACNSLALLVKMSESERNNLILNHVSADVHTQMTVMRAFATNNHFPRKLSRSITKHEFTQEFTCRIGEFSLPLYTTKIKKAGTSTLVPLPSTKQNLEAIALGISSNRPVLIEGDVGSGKTSLVEHLGIITKRYKAPELSKIQLSDQTDSKTLIGTYRCTANPGEFIWKAGSLTQAVMDGYWLLLEDIDFAPKDVISLLIPLLESRMLPVPGHGNVKAHPNFKVFATRRLLPAGCQARVGSASLLDKLWFTVFLYFLTPQELKDLICIKWPDLEAISEKLVEVYMVLCHGQHGESKPVEGCSQCGSENLTMAKTSGRFVSVRDLMKWCSRVVTHIHQKDLNQKAFQEAVDCFCAAVPDTQLRYSLALHIGSHLNVSEALVSFYLNTYKPDVASGSDSFTVGSRGQLVRQKTRHVSIMNRPKSTFSRTRLSSCLLEKVAVAVMHREPVLVVGETGTGKTSTIQYLSQRTNHPLKVINMNQQSDSADLLGGFKPVEVRTIVSPLRSEFEELFVNTFSAKQNTKFLMHVMTTFTQCRWKDLFMLMEHTMKKAIQKLGEEKKLKKSKASKNGASTSTKRTFMEVNGLLKKWNTFGRDLKQIMDQVERVKSSLAFAFIEGTLVKAIKQGEWVLLDEINLACPDTLECLTGLLERSSESVTLHERGDDKPIVRHPGFHLFACMNPATDVGKKELPVGLRNRFSEFFMDEFTEVEDLKHLVFEYLQRLNPSPKQITGIVDFYSKVKNLVAMELTDGTGQKPHFSLRTLCRALIVTRNNPCKNLARSLYEGFCLSFLTQLDRSSYPKVIQLIKTMILGSSLPSLGPQIKGILKTSIPCPGEPKDFVQVEGFWVPKGDQEPEPPDKYILTPTVRENLHDLARVVSIGHFPVLLQGDTSVGKTSLISYIAKLTGNKCVRINNHQHTDLQEYIGSYAPDETGKLVFKEGVLVKAMRNGHWIILDELNLAPTDVLEALNRLLDENRELFIPEIETTVKAHPKFMLFATQNPPGHYGGRQILSRAFRNRFVELHFSLIPSEELQTILQGRCEIPPSLSRKMVEALRDLQNRRTTTSMFQAFITLRDLFRWAERYQLAPKIEGFYDWDQHMADEGFLVLAAKIRVEEEIKAIKDVLKKHFKKEIHEERLFNHSDVTSPVTKHFLESLGTIQGFEHVVWTQDMKRLFVLVSKALSFCEPVLLVGETGCGKTTVCQIIAALKRQSLFTVNCHMHTEGADFLGGLRPVRERVEDDNRLFEWVDGPLIQAMREGGMFLVDEISLADDSVLERLNSVLEPERTLVLSEKGSTEAFSNLETLVAQHDFRLVGTMNPGGDYGKKELSPALRNRLTEIWCPKVEIERPASDVKLIIQHNIDASINQDSSVPEHMLNFLKYFTKTDIGKKLTVSIRDILSWVSFINKVVTDFKMDVGLAYVHGACLLFLDSLGSGSTGNSVLSWKKTKKVSLHGLCLQAQKITSEPFDPKMLYDPKTLVFRNDSEKFGIEPYLIAKGTCKPAVPPVFSFEAPKTCLNLLRLLMGLQLSRPILLEGSPGVGKTSLVIALAKASDNDIVRINLSEQTDVSDLFGADLPVEGSKGGRFAWRDGPLLQALKKGAWVVLDELNLASQSVLEGLNACFDHRGEIYVPELNKTFVVKHQSTKIFACQNPQYEGGARKGLPKSFLNRFSQVFIEPLSCSDMEFILGAIHSEIPGEIVARMVNFNKRLTEEILERKTFGSKGGPWELNLRDMFRWCEIMVRNQPPTRLNPGEFAELIYSDRLRTASDREQLREVYERAFSKDQFPFYHKAGMFAVNESYVQVGRAFLSRKTRGNEFVEEISRGLYLLQSQTPYMESLINCVNMGWMTLLVGGSGEGKTSLVQLLAQLAGERLETLSVNSHMDVTELLGGFEQADYGRRLADLTEELQEVIWGEMRSCLLSGRDGEVARNYLSLWAELCQIKDSRCLQTTTENVQHFMKVCQAILCIIEHLKKQRPSAEILKKMKELKIKCRQLSAAVTKADTISGGGSFEWVDSPLVQAIRNGYWLLIDGANLCSASVLDRLNGLLEPGGVLTVSERGVIRGKVPTIVPHPNFRLFFAMDPQYGEISRAMRNRGVEICVQEMWHNEMDKRTVVISQGIKDVATQNLLLLAHSSICDILPVYDRPSISSLGQCASIVWKLLQYGHIYKTSLSLALNLVYSRKMKKKEVLKVECCIKSVLKTLKADEKKRSTHKALPPVSRVYLSVETLLQSSSLGFATQLATLISVVKMNNNLAENVSALSLPEALPSNENISVCILLSLASLPLGTWELFKRLLANESYCDTLLECVERISDDPAICLQLLDEISDGQLPSDPRFNEIALRTKLEEENDSSLTSLSNKALLGLWTRIKDSFSGKVTRRGRRKHKVDKKNRSVQSVLELSKNISQGLVGENLVYHPSLRYIFPLLECISDFMNCISNDVDASLTDDDYFQMKCALAWKGRLERLCTQTVTKNSFHLFIPQLVFHWKQLQETFLDKISVSWVSLVSDEMNDVIQKLKEAFLYHCSPLHRIIPELRNHLGHPLPFNEEEYAKLSTELAAIFEMMSPAVGKQFTVEEQKVKFLSSEEGLEIKSNLIDIAFDASEEGSDKSRMIEFLTELKEVVNNSMSETNSGDLSSAQSVQLWPFVDYLASKQFSMLSLLNNGKQMLRENREALVKSSLFPLHLLSTKDSSKRLFDVACHLYNISNTSVVQPSKWLIGDFSEEENNDNKVHYWEDEENVILSQMGCLLTYQMLVGFCKPDEEIGDISVGNHAEREVQLIKMRHTLLQNWNTLSRPSNLYGSCFREKVKGFTSELVSSLIRTLNIDLPPCTVEDFHESLMQCDILIQHDELLQSERKELFHDLVEWGRANEEGTENLAEFAKLGIIAGTLQSWLLCHVEPLDPAMQSSLLLSYSNDELTEVKSILIWHKWIKILKYSNSADGIHPHVPLYENSEIKLMEEIKLLSEKVAYRPSPSQYLEIVEDMKNFMTSLFPPDKIKMYTDLLVNDHGSLNNLLEANLRSCDNFVGHMVKAYPLYRDLTVPFLHGVTLACESMRILLLLNRNRRLTLSLQNSQNAGTSEGITLDDILMRTMQFPSRREFSNPEQILVQNLNDQRKIDHLIKNNSQSVSFITLSHSLSLRASFYDLYNYVIANSSFTESTFSLMRRIMDRVIILWQEQEEEKKRKAEEEESLFKYKPRSLAISETEEEEIEREYTKIFPDYEEEFKDLEGPPSDTEDMSNEEKNSSVLTNSIKLTGPQLEEIVEIHELLMVEYAETPWILPQNNCSPKTTTPVALRAQQVQLLMRSIGPCGTYEVDTASIGSLSLINYLSCTSSGKPQQMSVMKRPFNFYHDCDLDEALKVRPLLEALQKKADELLIQWPFHPSLLMIKKVIHRVLGFSVNSPLIRLVIGLEMTLEKSQEWEKNSHKGVSLMAQLGPITNQVIEWRKMELKAWSSCLDLVTYKVSAEADIYWPHLYASLLSLTEENVNDVIQPLKQFLEESLIGNFKKRLEILRSFHSHLFLEAKYCIDENKENTFQMLIHLTWNLYKYYFQFMPLIDDTLKKSRKVIEKKVKDFIKIIRWNDINFFSVRDSVIKSRRTLHRHMRNWEKDLRKPFSPLLLDSSSDISGSQGDWDTYKEPELSTKVLKPTFTEAESIEEAEVNSLIGRLPSLTNKGANFVCEGLENMPYKDNVEALEEMTKQILTMYQELSLATAKAENIAEKEERLRKMKDVINRKKKSLAILFKSLHHMGVSYTKGNAIWRDNDLDIALTVPPMDIKVALKSVKDIGQISAYWDACDKYFYKGIGRHALLTKSLHQAHIDLGPEDIKRLRGSSCHLLILSRQLRFALPELCSSTSEIDELLNELNKTTKGFYPAVTEFEILSSTIYSSLVSLSLTLEEEIDLLKTFPKCEASLLTLYPASSQNVNHESAQSFIESFKAILSEIALLMAESGYECEAVRNSTRIRLSSCTNVEQMDKLVSSVSKIAERISANVTESDPDVETLTSLTKPLAIWTDKWNDLEAKFAEWKSNISVQEATSYTHSEDAEACLNKVLLAIEKFYKHHCEECKTTGMDSDEATKLMISVGMVNSLVLDFRHLNIVDVKKSIFGLATNLRENPRSDILIALKSMGPILSHYLVLCKNLLTAMVECFWSVSKLQSVLLGIFLQLATKGFCRPQELQEQEGDGQGSTKFEDSGPGLADGEGKKDVSERFESEDQLESALQEGEKEPDADKELEEDDGVEMSQDFEGTLQNKETDQEKGNDSEKEDEDEEELDKQMGETEEGAEKLDEKLWGDEEEDEKSDDGGGKEEKEEHGPGDEKRKESEIVAKDDNKSKDEKENERKKKKKEELERMEEDRREPAKEEEEEEMYGDDYKDRFGGEDEENKEEEEELLELPDNLNLDAMEGGESDKEEDVGDLNPEIEEKLLFPEEEREPREKQPQPEGDDEENADEEGQKEDENEDEEGEKREEKQTVVEEGSGDEKEKEGEEAGDKALPSKDNEAVEQALAADMDTIDASKDETKDEPKTALGAQLEQDEETKQEEHGQVGEQTDDVEGVGQSDSKTKEESHQGTTSNLANEDEAQQEIEQDKRRKPGDTEQAKSLGDVEKEIHQGLMTTKQSGPKEEEEEEEANVEEEKDVEKEGDGRDSSLYEHIGKADDHFDKQTVDAGKPEEARLRPAPLEEDEENGNKEELEGIEDTLMEVDEKEEEETKEETRKREAETEGNDGPDVKRSRNHNDEDGPEHKHETEGEIVLEMTVQRPLINEFYTRTEEEVAAAEFDEDLASTREKVEEAGEGDAKMGADLWANIEGKITPLSLQLCEQLRLILEPTEASKLRGDFRTGKRLNMRKVIPYIASQFRKDKIWLRRTQPNKRSYQVLLAVDDSQSMSEVNAGDLARESVALVAKALTLLEVGQVGVISFGHQTKLLHPFNKPFSDKDGAKIFANIQFSQSRTNFAQMLEDSVALLAGARGGQSVRSDVAQLLLILSDGQTHARSKAVRAAVRTARESRVFVVFLVLDAHDNRYSFYDACVYEDGQIKPMVESFPFPFFLVVRDLEGLPDIIAEALRQWFQLVTAEVT